MTRTLPRSAFFRYGVAAIGLALALVVTSQSQILADWAPYALFILTAIITTWLSGRAPGLLAVAVSPILINYFILPPHYSFKITEDLMMDLIAYFFVGVVVVLLTAELRKGRTALEKSEEYYRNLFDNNPLAMWVMDSDSFEFLAVNEAAVSAYGYSEAEFLSMTVKDIRRPGDVSELHSEIEEDPAELRHVDLTKHLKKDATLFDVEIYSHRTSFNGKEARQVVAIDITERSRVEKFARETEARMTSIIENMTEGLLVTDHTGRVVLANPRVLEIFEVKGISQIDGPHAFGLAFEMFELDGTLIPADKRPIVRLLAGEVDLEVNVRVRKKGSDWERVLRYAGTTIPSSNTELPLVVVTITDVTEKTAAEEAERASEERFRATFEQAAVGIAHVSPEGRFLRLNQKFCSLVGYSREEMVKLTFQDITHPDDLNADLENVKKLLSGVSDSYTMEKRYIKKSGDALSIRLTVSLLRKENGEPRFFVSVIEDITEHEQVQNALKQSQKQLAGIIGSAMDAIITIDVSGNVVLFNSSAETMFGCSAEEAIGGDLDRFIPQRHRNGHRHHIEEFGRTNVTRRSLESFGTLAGLRGNGEEFPIEASISQFETDGKKFFTVIIRDITSREMADEALRASEERYRDLVENARDVIYTHDLEGRFTSVNKIAEFFSGYTRDEMIGMKMGDIVDPEYLEEAAKMVNSKLSGESTTTYETKLIGKDGRRIAAEINSWLIYENGAPVGIQGIARDITERIDLEDKLRQSQKLEAVGLLAGGIAHDFNNLLTVITGYSDLSLKRMPPEDPSRKNIEQIKDAGARAAELTGQLLAFSRKQVLKPTVHNLNSVITNIERMLKRIIRESVELETDLAPDLSNIKADPGQIEQVIMNLAVNARDAMPNGGILTISTCNVSRGPEVLNIQDTCQPGEYVKMTVSDTGEGMSDETKRRMFEPFFTTKELGKGTGLGLATVHGIVKQSGGEIRVSSVVGEGTTFDIFFPCVDDEQEKQQWADRDVIDHSGTETILVVEDDANLRELVKTILVPHGYNVLSAADGSEALEICKTRPGQIHLLLTDVVMPQMSGIAVRDRVVELLPDIKVLFMSGYIEESPSDKKLLKTGDALIQKPFNPDSLSKKVREILDAKQE